MNFFGTDFMGDAKSILAVPNNTIKNLHITQGIFDNLYITSNVTSAYHSRPIVWGYDTIFNIDFKNNIMAGNVDFSLSEVSAILIKRRIKNTFDWTTLYKIDINELKDFEFERFDYYNQSQVEYEYALVPVINNIEGNYYVNSVYSEFEGIYIVNKDYVYQAIADVAITGLQRERPNAVYATLGRKYPYVISSGNTNYESGSVTGLFTSFNLQNNTINGFKENQYRTSFFDFLADGKPKILKDDTGRIWLIMITDSPSYEPMQSSAYPMGQSSFSFAETGDYQSSSDLYNNDMIDIYYEV